MRHSWWIVACFFGIQIILSCSNQDVLRRQDALLASGETFISFSSYEESLSLWDELLEIAQELNGSLSFWNPQSDLSQVNSQAGKAVSVFVKPETLYLIEQALIFFELSGGLYNPLIGPFVRLWGIGTPLARKPSQSEIQRLFPLLDKENIVIDHDASLVMLKKKGAALDLAALGKGFLVDHLSFYAQQAGIMTGLLNVGGTFRFWGQKKDGKPWRIGVRDVDSYENQSVLFVSLEEPTAISTAGIYERYFVQEGQRYHHVLNPRTGFPSQTDIISASILTQTALEADFLATLAVLLGSEATLNFLKESPGPRAVLIDTNKVIHIWGLRKNQIQLVNQDYSLQFH